MLPELEPLGRMTRSRDRYRAAYHRLLKKDREQTALLRECDLVLMLVPARHNPQLAGGRYLELLQTEHVAPLIKKLRGQA